MKERIKLKLTILGLEQEALFTKPSIRTPARLYTIAEQKRLLAEILANTQGDEDLVYGYLQGLYTKISNEPVTEEKWGRLNAWKVVSEYLVGKELTYDHFSDITEQRMKTFNRNRNLSLKNLLLGAFNRLFK